VQQRQPTAEVYQRAAALQGQVVQHQVAPITAPQSQS
jgi:hypothetical protein